MLASTPLLIKQIAPRVGYPDLQYFSSRFGKWVGMSPRAFRKRHTG